MRQTSISLYAPAFRRMILPPPPSSAGVPSRTTDPDVLVLIRTFRRERKTAKPATAMRLCCRIEQGNQSRHLSLAEGKLKVHHKHDRWREEHRI